MTDPYRTPGTAESDADRKTRWRREYEMLAMSGISSDRNANERALARMRELKQLLGSDAPVFSLPVSLCDDLFGFKL